MISEISQTQKDNSTYFLSYVCEYVHIDMFICVCMYTCIYMEMGGWVDWLIEGEREREGDRQIIDR